MLSFALPCPLVNRSGSTLCRHTGSCDEAHCSTLWPNREDVTHFRQGGGVVVVHFPTTTAPPCHRAVWRRWANLRGKGSKLPLGFSFPRNSAMPTWRNTLRLSVDRFQTIATRCLFTWAKKKEQKLDAIAFQSEAVMKAKKPNSINMVSFWLQASIFWE